MQPVYYPPAGAAPVYGSAPAPGPEQPGPYDLDLRGEAHQVPMIRIFLANGSALSVPKKTEDWPVGAIEHMVNSRGRSGLEMLFGREDERLGWVTGRELEMIVQHVITISGVTPGESDSSATG